MDLKFADKLGRGGFGDVWRAEDPALSRTVAVKFIRESGEHIASAATHGRPLSRIDHPNVVKVYALEDHPHPDTRETLQAIVMEYVDGTDLTERLRTPIELESANTLISQLCDGLKAIHSAGFTHGDLHSDNVRVTGTGIIKIIDVLHRGTFRVPADAAGISRDTQQLIQNITSILLQTPIPQELTLAAKSDMLSETISVDEVRKRFLELLARENESARRLELSYQTFTSDNFPGTPAYAEALIDEIPPDSIDAFLIRIVRDARVLPAHTEFLRRIWTRASTATQDAVLRTISDYLRIAGTDEARVRPFRLIEGFGPTEWPRLAALPRLQAEAAIINSVAAGHYDIRHPAGIRGGQFGRWAAVFGQYFETSNRANFLASINNLLRQNWYTQNYVAVYFFPHLATLNLTPAEERDLSYNIRMAIRNDATEVVNRLNALPPTLQVTTP